MSAATGACPPEDLLLELASGSLDGPDATSLHEHIDSCRSCLHVVAELMRAGEDGPTLYPSRYKMIEENARGGQARVLRGIDTVTQREVAIKELLPADEAAEGSQRHEKVKQRFVREARLTARLTHPGIVPIYDIGVREDGQPFYTMQFLHGQTLSQMLRACAAPAERLRYLSHFLELCHAVAFAHSRKIVHRDIKPHNVVIGEFGQTVLVDWGLAKLTSEAHDPAMALEDPLETAPATAGPDATVAGTVIGTPAYMSPEQASGRLEDIDERSDVFGLGAVLYEILTGKAPLVGRHVTELLESARAARLAPVTELNPEAPAELVVIAHKALALDRAERYERAADLASDIQAYLTGGRVAAYGYSSWELLRRLVTRHKRTAVASAAAVSALVVALAALTVALRRADHERERAEVNGAATLVEGAQAALSSNALVEARARLRTSLETADSLEARSIWRELSTNPLLWRHHIGGELNALDASPKERLLAVAGQRSGIRLIDAQTLEIRVLPTQRQVVAVGFSPDGRTLAAGDVAGEAWLWDLETSRVRSLGSADDAIIILRFAPDGGTFFSVSQDGRLWRFDTDGGEPPVRIPTSAPLSRGLAVSPDGRRLALITGAAQMRLMELATGEEVGVECPATPQMSMAFSPDGQWLAALAAGGQIHVWPSATATRATPRLLESGAGGTLSFSPDGKLLASANVDGYLRLWDPATGALRRSLHEGTNVFARQPSWMHDGRAVGIIFLDGTVKLFSTETMASPAGETISPGPRAAVQFSPDGTSIATAGSDGMLRFHDRVSGQQRFSVKGHDGGGHGIAYSRDGTRVASAGADAMVRIWDAESGRPIETLAGHSGAVGHVGFSTSGRSLVSLGPGIIRIWDIDSGTVRADLERLEFGDPAIDAEEVASWDARGSVSRWEIENGRPLGRVHVTSEAIQAIAYVDEARALAILTESGQLLVLNTLTGSVRELGTSPCRNNRCVFAGARRGQLLATGHSEGDITLWDVGTSRATTIESDEPCALAFAPDGKHLAAAQCDGALQLWDLTSGRPMWRGPLLRSRHDEVFTHRGWTDLAGQPMAAPATTRWAGAVSEQGRLAAESDDGDVACLASFDGTLEVWSLRSDSRLAHAPVPGVSRMIATTTGCLALAGDVAVWIDLGGRSTRLIEQASAIAQAGDELLVVAGDQLVVTSATGTPIRREPIEPGVSAVARTAGGELVTGHAHGGVSVWKRDGERLVVRDTPHSPVVHIVDGPGELLGVAFLDGTIAVWSAATGEKLMGAWLLGAATHLRMRRNVLVAVTEVGQLGAWDMEVFSMPYCQLLQRVWSMVPVIWERGRPVLRRAPDAHRCTPQ